MSKSVYLSASNQPGNHGPNGYIEETEMHKLKDKTKKILVRHGLIVYTNEIGWTRTESIKDSNSKNPDAHVAFHSNASKDKKTQGTEIFYYHQTGPSSNSYKLASCLYKYIAPISPGPQDRGILPDNAYFKQLDEIQSTKASAALTEYFFHTSPEDVNHWYTHIDAYATATAIGILEYFGIKYVPPSNEPEYIAKMRKSGVDMVREWCEAVDFAVKLSSTQGNEKLKIFAYFPELIKKIKG